MVNAKMVGIRKLTASTLPFLRRNTTRPSNPRKKITYILYEEDSQFEGQDCREDVIAENYELVYENPGGSIRIYKTSES